MSNQESIELSSLLLHPTSTDANVFVFADKAENLEGYDPTDAVSDQRIVFIDRFNKSAIRLINAILAMNNAATLLSLGNALASNELRDACRNVYSEIDVYIEKVKSFCRYYFFLEESYTEDGKKWVLTMKQFENMPDKQGETVSTFLKICKQVWDEPVITDIKNIRNDEMHNESQIDTYHYDLTPASNGAIMPVVIAPIISDEKLYQRATQAVHSLVPLAEALQDIINYIPPYAVRTYVKESQLKHTISPAHRWKKYSTKSIYNTGLSNK